MKSINSAHFEKHQYMTDEIRNYIKTHSFEVLEKYKNILKAEAALKPEMKSKTIQEAHNKIYSSRKANPETIMALEYIYSICQEDESKLNDLIKELEIDIPNLHPTIAAQRELTHRQTQATVPDISEEFVEAVNRHNS